jgi:UDP-4-amino-4,6-dideoxy-N-acetyl-beta-L-altrosamine transaminase
MIPYGRQDINQEDIDSVIKVLKSDFLTQGPQVPLFENVVTSYCGANYGVAVNSATSALHIACLALGLGKGDILWTSPNSFVASSNCALYCGAEVDFVDIDTETYNLSISELEKKLVKGKKENKLPKIVVPVHFAGQSCDMKQIHLLSQEYGFKIIEDASHAIGGKYLNRPVGSCQFSDITVFSFHPVKIVTSAEGGLAATNNEKLANNMKLFRSHGITRDKDKMTFEPQGDWDYQQIHLGFNYRMTDLQAALGISQMNRIDEFVSKRHVLKQRYDSFLDSTLLIKPFQDLHCFSSLHLYPIRIKSNNNIIKKRKFCFNTLRKNGVGVNVHYKPIHSQPYYKQFGFEKGDYPNAEAYYDSSISLPLFPDLSFDLQDQIIKLTNQILFNEN